MLLGHVAFAEQAFQDARLDAIHNIEFTEAGNVSSYEMTSSTGSETVTGTASISLDGSSVTFGLGDETAFGDAFQNLITFSAGSLDLVIWNEVDDSETSSWTLVDPGSTD
tara:strand:- start:211 stop:540 length:330 start_codon:yes stop_codon:yes gene_type:complete